MWPWQWAPWAKSLAITQHACHEAGVTNSIAITLGILIAAAIAADVIIFDSANLVFLGKKGIELLEWIAIWR